MNESYPSHRAPQQNPLKLYIVSLASINDDPESFRRKEVVRTHFSLKRSDKISNLEKQVKEGKEGLKKMVDTGQAEEYKNLPGQHKKKGFNK